MSTTAKQAWLRVLRTIGVKHFRATSALGLPYVCHVGDEAGEAFFYNRQLSVPELAMMSAWCETIDSPVIFDIGANNGFIATQLAQLLRNKSPRIYAFEPVPSTFAQLRWSIDSLGLNDVVFPICRALSNSNSEAKLFYNPRQSLFAQIRNDDLNPRVGSECVSVETTTVDQIVDSLRVTPNLLKVDVEGFEPRIFKGASRLLNGNEPPAICFEWNPLTLSESNSSTSEVMSSLPGYSFYYIDDFEGQRKPLGELLDSAAQIDWVCNVIALPNSVPGERWFQVRTAAIGAMQSYSKAP